MVRKMGTVYAFLALVAISTIANVSAARYDLARVCFALPGTRPPLPRAMPWLLRAIACMCALPRAHGLLN